MLTDIEVFAVRAAGLPENLCRSLYPELFVCDPCICDEHGNVHDVIGEWRGVCPNFREGQP